VTAHSVNGYWLLIFQRNLICALPFLKKINVQCYEILSSVSEESPQNIRNMSSNGNNSITTFYSNIWNHSPMPRMFHFWISGCKDHQQSVQRVHMHGQHMPYAVKVLKVHNFQEWIMNCVHSAWMTVCAFLLTWQKYLHVCCSMIGVHICLFQPTPVFKMKSEWSTYTWCTDIHSEASFAHIAGRAKSVAFIKK
jgi:hypothetical protein